MITPIQSTIPGLSLLSTIILPILFLVPGLVGLRAGIWTARRRDSLTRLETISYSVLMSTASFVLIYILLSIILWQPVAIEDLDLSLAALITGYLVHFVISSLLGVIFGSLTYNYIFDNTFRDQFDSWDFAFKYIHQSKDVIVKTVGGVWIEGHVVQHGRSGGTRDLLLSSPRIVGDESNDGDIDFGEILQGSGADNKDPENFDLDDVDEIGDELGEYIYINEPDIEAVGFADKSDENPDESIFLNDRVQELLAPVYSKYKFLNISFFLQRVSEYFRFRGDSYTLLGISVIAGLYIAAVDNFTQWISIFGFLTGALGSSITTDNHSWGISGMITRWLVVAPFCLFLIYVYLSSSGVTPLYGLLSLGVGTLVFQVHNRIKEQYGVVPSWYITLGIGCLISLSALWGRRIGDLAWTGRIFSLLFVLLVVLLFVNRMRVGVASKYERWPKVAVDTTYNSVLYVLAMALAGWPYRLQQSTEIHFIGLTVAVGVVYLFFFNNSLLKWYSKVY